MCSISPVWVSRCTVADTEQVVLPHVYSSWSLLKADYTKNFFLLKYHVNFCLSRGKVYTENYSLFKANVTFLFWEENWPVWGGRAQLCSLLKLCLCAKLVINLALVCGENKGKPERSSVYVYSIESICINKDLKLAN